MSGALIFILIMSLFIFGSLFLIVDMLYSSTHAEEQIKINSSKYYELEEQNVMYNDYLEE